MMANISLLFMQYFLFPDVVRRDELKIYKYRIYINNFPTRCNTKQSIYYSASSLYSFRVSNTPIIRSTQNCNCSLRYRSYLPATWPSLAMLEGGSCTKKI